MSKKNLNKLVVIDLEATCWPNRESIPRGQQQEIIEIGVALVDLQNLRIDLNEGIIVKPEKSKISDFCTKLTTITQEMVDSGVTLKQAMDKLQNVYHIDEYTYASWGDFDRKLLISDCADKRIYFPGEKRSHINIKNVLPIEYGWNKEVGLDAGLELFGLKLEGTHHRGIDDAFNIARIWITHLSKIRLARIEYQSVDSLRQKNPLV